MKSKIAALTWTEVAARLGAIASRAGSGFCYDQKGHACVYFYEGEPSCIIGHLLAELGIPANVAYEAQNFHTLATSGKYPEITALFDEKAVLYATAVQRLQDRGVPWLAAARAPEMWFNHNLVHHMDHVDVLLLSWYDAFMHGRGFQRLVHLKEPTENVAYV